LQFRIKTLSVGAEGSRIKELNQDFPVIFFGGLGGQAQRGDMDNVLDILRRLEHRVLQWMRKKAIAELPCVCSNIFSHLVSSQRPGHKDMRRDPNSLDWNIDIVK